MYYQLKTLENLSDTINGVFYEEEWATFPEFPTYSVSTFGRVKSLRSNKIMHQQVNERGYLVTSLVYNGIRKKFKCHRLVAMVFIPNPLNKPEVNHDDFNKCNNFFKNLEWSTPKENTEHAKRGGKRPTRKEPKPKIGEYPIRCQKIIDTSNGNIYDSVHHLSEILKVTPKYIRKKLSGEIFNDTPYRWLKGQYSLFYKKRYESDLQRYHELKRKIYGIAV